MEPFKLGNWQVFPKLNQLILISNGKIETVTPKIMQLLTVLISHGNEPASVEQLITSVWQNRVVADSSVYQAVAQLRKVLAQDDEQSIYIERISGQGYRICPDIKISAISAQKSNAKPPWLLIGLTISVFFVVVLYLFTQSKNQPANKYFESLSLAGHLLNKTKPAQLHHAKQLYLEVLHQDPSNVEALNGLCNNYRLLAIYDSMSEAERDSLCQPLLEKAYAAAPNNPHVLASIAKQAFELGDINKSASFFEQALAITEQEATIWHWYGKLKRSQNDIQAALTAHKKAFRLAPNDPVVLRGLAYAYLNNRDLANARKYFERSIVIAPNFKNRPLYELDFYPLNQQRAKHYLAWYHQYGDSYLKRFPVYSLTYAAFLLSINQGELAAEELKQVEALDDISEGFLLYVKASLLWHNQQPEQALTLLQQRYQLAPEQNHLVMPYLLALYHLNKNAQALALFEQHFANIVALDTIEQEQLGQYLLLTSLYKSLGKEQAYQQAFAKLLSLRQQLNTFPVQQELIWLELTDNKKQVFEFLMQMLTDGWLPDYNDSMFSIGYYQSLIESKQERNHWLEKLREKQACIWQSQKCNLDD